MNKTKYMQTDSRWGGLGYPKKPYYIRNCGCGEVSIANIIIEMQKYANYTPATIQPYCKQYADPKGNGTYWSGIPKMMKKYGLTDVKEHATMKPLWDELAKGNRVAVYLMGSRKGGSKGVKWTSGGHFVCSVGYKYENGKHYVFVKDSYSNASNRNGWITYEENMKNDVLKVWSGKLPSSDPTPPTPDGKLVVDGIGGEATVNRLQEFLGVSKTGGITIRKDLQKYVPALKAYDYGNGSPTVKAMQKWLGLSNPDGLWGANTSKALQKKLGVAQDGIFGANSMKALQTYLNTHDKADYPPEPTPTPKPTGASKIVAKAKEYAWAYGTASKRYAYNTGSAKSAYKTALKKWLGKSAKVSQSDCGYFVSTCVRASGVSTSFLALPASYKKAYPSVPSTMQIVSKGSVGTLKAGDIIRYRKSSGQHTVIYLGDGLIAHASRKHAFPRIAKSKPWTNSGVKKSTIQVIRAK